MQETKQHIKSRMLKDASRLWGYSDTQMENSFDPLVALLFEGCAAELEKLSSDIYASRARVMERLVQVLCPETLTGALPAHGLMSAEPIEDISFVDESMQFFTQIKENKSAELKSRQTLDVFFSPICNFQLKKLDIKYLVAGNKFYKLKGSHKELLGQSKGSFGSTVWLGISGANLNLDGLRIYFDTVLSEDKSFFSNLLNKTRWFYNGTFLETQIGLELSENRNIESILKFRQSKSSNILHQVIKNVDSFYSRNFITVNDKKGITQDLQHAGVLERLLKQFDSSIAETFINSDVRWIEIQFPEHFAGFNFENLICRTNCFPVINRQIHNINYAVKELVNIIPLNSEDSFLDLEKIQLKDGDTDSADLLFPNENKLPIVLQRNGSIGRFDERDAKGLLDNLIDVLRQESASFSKFNNDFIYSEVKKLQQIFNKIEFVLNEKYDSKFSSPFLLVNQHESYQDRNIWITYSSTLGSKANYIKPGTILHAYNSHSFVCQNNELVTICIGGREKLNVNQSILAFRSALLSQNRIHSEADIKAFVMSELGEIVNKVDIKKVMKINPDPNISFEKVIEIQIGLIEGALEGINGEQTIEYWEKNLAIQLATKTLTWFPIKVLLLRNKN
ncbi:type VI secretion system baseplate subunit TssF [Cognataquiflexum rubidum]|uniref:type VI secretion system baseplate subunit TssF n=1 Tax=Cognataquiflexum rubidum TaxID=2922273 RepID=UPI001F13A870|nr:type VI secretion system baseplate subunit TssF [Cognataquiflexum rubidum]MCH6234203.1 type VI secretion system baseplate subunit TssF [Cognataquiflexum rubidum]